MIKELEIIAEHADYIGSRGDRRCTCGWSSGRNGQHSRLSFAEHVVSVLSARGYSIVERSELDDVKASREQALELARKWSIAAKVARSFQMNWPAECLMEAAGFIIGTSAAAAGEGK